MSKPVKKSVSIFLIGTLSVSGSFDEKEFDSLGCLSQEGTGRTFGGGLEAHSRLEEGKKLASRLLPRERTLIPGLNGYFKMAAGEHRPGFRWGWGG